jgi:hypothetical protein
LSLDCNETQTNAEHCEHFRQGSAKDFDDGQPSAAPLPADLAGLVARWPSFPEHIKAAILAMAGTVKPLE